MLEDTADSAERNMSNVFRIDEERIRGHLAEVSALVSGRP